MRSLLHLHVDKVMTVVAFGALVVTGPGQRLTAQDEPVAVPVVAGTACIGPLGHIDPTIGTWLQPPLSVGPEQVMVTFFAEDSQYRALGEADCKPLEERSREETLAQATADGSRSVLEVMWPDGVGTLVMARASAMTPAPTVPITSSEPVVTMEPAATSTPAPVAVATPAPTATPRPAAATPQAVPPSTVLLSDDFSKPDTGVLPKSATLPNREQGYVDGEYFMRLSTGSVGRGPYATISGTFSNVTIGVDVRILDDVSGKYGGLSCRISNLGNYLVQVRPRTRTVRLQYNPSSGGGVLIKSVTSSQVAPGNAVNRLELSCIGSTLTVKVNGTVVIQETDGRFTEGSAALQCGGDQNLAVECRFDNLLVTQE